MGRKILLVVLGLVVVGGVVAGVYAVGNRGKKVTPIASAPPVATPTPSPTLSAKPGERIAQLKAIGNVSGDGTAVRSFTAGHFLVRIQVALPDPPSGKFYEAYLERKTPAPVSQFSIGKLKQENGEWTLTLDQTRDASTYSSVFVSLEAADDKKPELKLLEGSF